MIEATNESSDWEREICKRQGQRDSVKPEREKIEICLLTFVVVDMLVVRMSTIRRVERSKPEQLFPRSALQLPLPFAPPFSLPLPSSSDSHTSVHALSHPLTQKRSTRLACRTEDTKAEEVRTSPCSSSSPSRPIVADHPSRASVQ